MHAVNTSGFAAPVVLSTTISLVNDLIVIVK
jgi:hypothetical protein